MKRSSLSICHYRRHPITRSSNKSNCHNWQHSHSLALEMNHKLCRHKLILLTSGGQRKQAKFQDSRESLAKSDACTCTCVVHICFSIDYRDTCIHGIGNGITCAIVPHSNAPETLPRIHSARKDLVKARSPFEDI